MEEKNFRVRIHPTLYKRYKLICIEHDLSMPRQTSELIRTFVEIQERNLKALNDAKDRF